MEFMVFMPGRGKPARSACKARALAMRSIGKLLAAGGGRRALFRVPVTLEFGWIPRPGLWPCGSETVRKDGTRRGGSLGAN